MKLTVVTWNIHRCIGTDRRYDPDRVARVLKSLDADIVALQEVDTSLKATFDGNDEDQLAVIAKVTGLEPIYGATRTQASGHFGNAFLHRHRTVAKHTLNLSYRKYEPRGALSVRLDVNGKSVNLINTHLGLKGWERAFQLSKLLKEFERAQSETSQPVISLLLGDFNEWFPFSPNLLRLHREVLKPPYLRTFPSFWPRLALDRIYLDRRARSQTVSAASRHEVIATQLARVASDHLPVLAEFEI